MAEIYFFLNLDDPRMCAYTYPVWTAVTVNPISDSPSLIGRWVVVMFFIFGISMFASLCKS